MPQETSNPAAASKLGKYELLQEFAGSGVASTWIARAPDGPGLFSILRLHQHIAKRVEVAEEFLREARQIRDFRHPNVISLVETGVADGEVFVVSEYVEGESLATLLAQARAEGLALAVTLRIGLDLLEGLAAAHGHKPDAIVHKELNPYHVIVGADGIARINSFGIAHALSKIGTHGVMRPDRLSYGAPERVRAMAAAASATVAEGPVDTRSDLFSAAVILWECIAKQRLFGSKMEPAVIQKVLSAPIPSLSSLPDITVPEDVSEIIQKALERDLARRCSTADEFIMSLEGAGPDVIASQEQVAALVDKLAGKQIATRRKEIEEGPTAKKLSDRVGPGADLRSRLRTSIGLAPGAASTQANVPSKLAKSDLVSKPAAPPAAARQGPAVPPIPPLEKETATKEPRAAEAAAKEAPSEAAAKEAPSEAAAKEAAATEAPSEAAAKEAPANEVVAKDTPAKEVAARAPAPAPRPSADLATSRTPLGPPVVSAKPAPKPVGGAKSDVRKPPPPPAPRLAAAPAKLPPPGRISSPGAAPKPPSAPPRLAADKAKPEPGASPPAAPPAAGSAPVAADAADKARLESIPPTKILGPDAAAATVPLTDEASAPASLTPRGRAAAALGYVRPFSTLGRYEILMHVATGGMAVVWAARQQGSRGFQKIVAIKTMLPDVSDDPDFETMFLDEARVAARIRHPNVVEILDLGEENDVLYIAMEWVEGTTLSALMKAARPTGGIPLPLAIRIASQVCAGLHGAHELRDDRGALVDLVHRDVSPVNILVSTTGFAKVADFGVAKSKVRQHVTRAGGIVKGKTPYLSPEQFEGRVLDRRSDIFSLGVLMYYMITGQHPFRGETDTETLENMTLKNPKPLRALVPSLDPEVERIVLKALEKDREKRFATAAEMQRALELVAPSLGPVTTNDDVAELVRKTVGDVLEKNAAELRKAIAVADAGPAQAQPSVSAATGDAAGAVPASAVPASEGPVSEAPVSAVPVSVDGDLAEEVQFDEDVSERTSKEEPAPAEKAATASTPPAEPDKPAAAHKPGDSSPPATEQAAAAVPADRPDKDDRAAETGGGLMVALKKNRTAQLVVGGIAAAAMLVIWFSLSGKEPEPTGAQSTRVGAPSENVVATPAATQPAAPPAQPELPPAQPPTVEAQPASAALEPASSSEPPPVVAAVEPVSPPATTAKSTAPEKSPGTSAPAASPAATQTATTTKTATTTTKTGTTKTGTTTKPGTTTTTKTGTKKYTPKGI